MPRIVIVKLRTARLIIEPLVEADIPSFVEYRRRPDVARFQSWTRDYSTAQARDLVAAQPTDDLPAPGNWLQLAMRHDERLVGDLAVYTLDGQPDSYELGVTVGQQRQGFAREGMTALIAHLLGLGARRIVAESDARNEPVAGLLEAVGFRRESRQADAEWFKQEWVTLDGWVLSRPVETGRRVTGRG